jgi:hypothetical protein
MKPNLSCSWIALALLAGACGDDAITTGCPDTGQYLALRDGARWTYRVTGADGVIDDKVQVVGPLEDVGGAKAGVMAHRLTTTKPGGTVTSWQADDGASIVRHRERDQAGAESTDEIYAPHRTRFDGTLAHTTVGATWTEDYTETVTDGAGQVTTVAKRETWRVEAQDELVTVAAGQFCTLRVRRSSVVAGQPGSDKTYWFARGVGKVKEVGAGQVEELVQYE